MAPAVAALIPILGNMFDRIFPDAKAAGEAKLEVMRMAQAGELAQLDAELKLATGQIEINKVEAASQSLFVAGWRPAIGWVCGAAFAFKFILGPGCRGHGRRRAPDHAAGVRLLGDEHYLAGAAWLGRAAHCGEGQGRLVGSIVSITRS